MRILFDAYWWVEGPISNRLVEREIIRAWIGRFPDEVGLVVPKAHLEAARADCPDSVELFGAGLRPHAVAAALEYPRIAKRFKADLTITHNFAPLRGRSAIFMHDVLERSNPEWFTRAERLYYGAKPVLGPRADVVFTSSANEAARIRRYNPRMRKVVPIGLSVADELLTAQPSPPAEFTGPSAPTDGFLLCVARLNVRKNLAVALEAALSTDTLSPARPLVIVGEKEGKVEELSAEARAAIGDGRVRLLDRVTNGELVWLYQHARLFLFPSLEEGFGLPPIEALHFGAPVLAADIPVLRETLAGLADFADPRSVPAFAHGIERALAQPAHRVTVPPGRFTTWTDMVELMRSELTGG
jgi:glycosyltransferase involved in cell wall biosynthesis